MKYGCIGERLGHSFSAVIHGKLGNRDYRLVELAPTELEHFLRERDFLGINVTIPYKEAVLPYLDQIDEGARQIGAVNTVVNRGGRLYGYNTDFYGMTRLIEHAGVSIAGKSVAILGSGGTSRTAHAVAKSLGAKEIYRVSRRLSDGVIDYRILEKEHSNIDIIINTTPVGMYPNADASPVDLSKFPSLSGVIDAVYNPLRTKLVLAARERSIPAECGLYMLVAQAVRASELFFDTVYEKEVCERIFREVRAEKESIALIGMPASGKTTVGRLLAKKMNRTLVDTDACIVERIGIPIAEYIAKYGESAFRKIESEVVRDAAAPLGSAIISTGGGVVLNRENVNNLLQNSRIYFLDRPLELLMPTKDRPLSSTKEALECRYHERYDIYKSSADVHVDGAPDAEGVAEFIRKEFLR